MLYFMVASTILSIIGALYIAAFRKANKILRQLIQVNNKNISVVNAGLKRECFEVETLDRHKVTGYIAKPYENPRGIIVLCHNLGGSKEAMLRYAKFLCEAGYAAVGFDFLNHGESEKINKIYFDHSPELAAVTQYIRRTGYGGLPMGIFALSMGTVAGIMHSSVDSGIKSVVLEGGPFLYINDYLEYVAGLNGIKNRLFKSAFVKLCFLITDLRAIEVKTTTALIKLRETPTLFIQGEKDFMNPPGSTQKALSIMNSPVAEYWMIQGAYHLTGLHIARDAYKERVVGFFDKHVAEVQARTDTTYKERFVI